MRARPRRGARPEGGGGSPDTPARLLAPCRGGEGLGKAPRVFPAGRCPPGGVVGGKKSTGGARGPGPHTAQAAKKAHRVTVSAEKSVLSPCFVTSLRFPRGS